MLLKNTLQRHARFYSSGIDISAYLTRIQAAASRKVTPHKRENNSDGRGPFNGGQNRRAPGAQAGAQTGAQTRGNNRNKRPQVQRAQGAQAPRAPRAADSVDAASAPRASSARASAAPRAPAPAPQPVETTEWSVLDSTADPAPTATGPRRPLTMKTRRSSVQRLASARTRTPRAPRKVGASAPVDDRTYIPYLAQDAAVDVLLQNSNTGNAGFIPAFDVSLPALQPDLLTSAATYNTRVRSLLNEISTSSNKEEAFKTAQNLVEGRLSTQILENEEFDLVNVINKNRSLDLKTRKFLADVAMGRASVERTK